MNALGPEVGRSLALVQELLERGGCRPQLGRLRRALAAEPMFDSLLETSEQNKQVRRSYSRGASDTTPPPPVGKNGPVPAEAIAEIDYIVAALETALAQARRLLPQARRASGGSGRGGAGARRRSSAAGSSGSAAGRASAATGVVKAARTSSAGRVRYCVCRRPSKGDMIACDNADCEMQWFHLACIGMTKVPRGKWYCDACRHALGV